MRLVKSRETEDLGTAVRERNDYIYVTLEHGRTFRVVGCRNSSWLMPKVSEEARWTMELPRERKR